MTNKLSGLFAATFTPMHSDGALNLDEVPKMVSHLKRTGVSGVYVCGSTGEGMSLTTAERMELTEAFVNAAKGQMTVIAHVGHNSLREARQLAEHAATVGVDVISATAPSYYKIGSAQILIDSMAEVAAGAPELPFYYYHIPLLTGSSISMPLFMEQASKKIPNLVGLKYTAPLIHEFQSAMNVCNGKFDVLWGTDEMLLSALIVGAKGAIGSTYNVKAMLDNQIVQAFEAGDLEKAKTLQLRSVEFINLLLSYPFHAAMKSLLTRFGIACGPCRVPLENLTAEQEKQLHQQLDERGFSEWLFESPSSAPISRMHMKMSKDGVTTNSTR